MTSGLTVLNPGRLDLASFRPETEPGQLLFSWLCQPNLRHIWDDQPGQKSMASFVG